MRGALGGSGCALALLLAAAAHGQTGVKIGVLNDQSSIYADVSGMGSVEAARMAIEDVGGAALGNRVELVFADDENKPEIAAKIVRTWFDADIDAIVDLPNSSAMLAVQEIARDAKKIAIVSSGATSNFTNRACSPYGVHWTYDSYALAHGTAKHLVEQGGNTWFFVTLDDTAGQALEGDTANVVKAAGATVLGVARYPSPNQNLSPYLLQARASRAKVIGLTTAGSDAINAVKQALELGVTQRGQRIAALLLFDSDIQRLGLHAAQGMLVTTAFYWDFDDGTRAFAKRFFDRLKTIPTMAQAGVYSAVRHYLSAVQAAGSKEALAVLAKMREMPVHDFFAKNGFLREDGRMVHDMYLAQVKAPEESQYNGDFLKILKVIPGREAFRPIAESECALLGRR
jgi:branched-chain amino acid transport system substrate-binding protein